MLHENTSTLEEQRFTSTFDGNEFFLKDHVVNGNKVLPGVAYIEMTRAALEKATGISDKTIKLENIVWVQPFVLNEEIKGINIGLYPDDTEGIAYEIYEDTEVNENEEEIIYSQGRGSIVKKSEEIEIKDIEGIKKECNKKVISGKECYEIFEKIIQ